MDLGGLCYKAEYAQNALYKALKELMKKSALLSVRSLAQQETLLLY